MYKIIYEIEVDASSHAEAALKVEEIMKDSLYRPVLKVTDNSGKTIEIDLHAEQLEKT